MIYISKETLRILLYRYKVYNEHLLVMCNDMNLLYYKESCARCPYLCDDSCGTANRHKILR